MTIVRNELVLHITTEPGDGTRYDFFMMQDGPDEYTFAPGRTTFIIPQRLNAYVAEAYNKAWHNSQEEESQDVHRAIFTEQQQMLPGLNPHTLAEFCRVVTLARRGLLRDES